MQDSPQRVPECREGTGCLLCGIEEVSPPEAGAGRAKARTIDSFLTRLDPLLTGPLGIPLLLVGLYVLLLAIMRAGTLLVGFVDSAAALVLAELPGRLLGALRAPRWVASVLVGGIGAGVRAVVALVPLIFVISFALSYLDQWGWMARAARALEAVLGRVGLTGRALAPLLAGFGCTVPAVLALRASSVDARREQRLALFVAPLFSCSAQALGLRRLCRGLLPRRPGARGAVAVRRGVAARGGHGRAAEPDAAARPRAGTPRDPRALSPAAGVRRRAAVRGTAQGTSPWAPVV